VANNSKFGVDQPHNNLPQNSYQKLHLNSNLMTKNLLSDQNNRSHLFIGCILLSFFIYKALNKVKNIKTLAELFQLVANF
jgi:hypothetical protein